MYRPVATTWVLYVEGFFASYFFAYSWGTGALIGITSAADTLTASGWLSLNAVVVSAGVVMPEIDLAPVDGFVGAPTIELKYDGYWPPTLIEKKRSKAYL